MPNFPSLPTPAAANFRIQMAGGREGPPIAIHFNPASLEYTVSNEMKNQPGGRKKQYVEKSKATLKMQLVYDTTDTGVDVRAHTGPVSRLLKPVQEAGKPVPPTVKFEWGGYHFTGMVEQYKEVLDFFSAEGVPLRSTVDVTLSDQDFQFSPEELRSGDTSGGNGVEPAVVPSGPGGASDVANQLGDPRAARSIAAANGADSLRAGAGGSMAVGGGGGVSLKGEAGFSAGASAGIGFGASAKAGAGASAGAGLGFGASASASASASGFGAKASASAGSSAKAPSLSFSASAKSETTSKASGGSSFSHSASATAGGGTAKAFAELRVTPPPAPSMPSATLAISAGAGIGASAGASLSLGAGAKAGAGGKASPGKGGLSAEVGVDADLNAFIKFG